MKKRRLLPKDFKKATLQQLSQILRNEECDLVFKCAAESEMTRRAAESGLSMVGIKF